MLRKELKEAAAAGRPVCIGGARHSMGGQSLAGASTAVTLDRGWCRPEPRTSAYLASAGARWRDVIPVLDKIGFAPKVTQANSDFTLGGAFSVNVHGWAAPLGPMGATVRAATLMLADGEIVRCSRTEEQSLFRLATGGYGLFGVILDLEIEMVRNVRLVPQFRRLPAKTFGPAFVAALHDPRTRMGYGRLSVSKGRFLQEAFMVTYHEVAGRPEPLTPGRVDVMDDLTRRIYRAQTGSDAWKELRWFAETHLSPQLDHRAVTRNALISTPVSALAATRSDRTDILHEYFLPPDRLAAFLADCRDIIPRSGAELLNVTLRYVAADTQSLLAFAPQDRVAAVMSFSQEASLQADQRMKPVTQALIDAALRHGGSFYLPYRLHARADQIERAYPHLDEFVRSKRELDPKALFRNTMWDVYFSPRG
ncbi:FAD-binding oxidoreductase [Phenylobacterium sp. LjRoot225]|uniref:FAD-binding protein n=1 Tax=Phenylobacterium sp. LjRoot225 TaxID=3342285 RepID=UPI003ED02E1D